MRGTRGTDVRDGKRAVLGTKNKPTLGDGSDLDMTRVQPRFQVSFNNLMERNTKENGFVFSLFFLGGGTNNVSQRKIKDHNPNKFKIKPGASSAPRVRPRQASFLRNVVLLDHGKVLDNSRRGNTQASTANTLASGAKKSFVSIISAAAKPTIEAKQTTGINLTATKSFHDIKTPTNKLVKTIFTKTTTTTPRSPTSVGS